jgi:iron(III) transport system permease protein
VILKIRINGEGMTLAILVLIALLLLAMPMVLLAKVGLSSDDGISLARFAQVLDSRSVQRALWNSLESGVLSALVAVVFGTMVALVVGLTDIRAKGVLVFLILLPMMIPPHVTAISWIQALGPSSPVMQWLGIAPEIGTTHPLYSRGGVIMLLALQHAPMVFLVVLAALRSFPREMIEAARISGGRPLRLFTRILLPLLRPYLVAGFSLAFVSALGNFGIQALLGIPARYTTLPVLIWQRLASFGPDVLADLAVISSLLIAVAVAVVVLQVALQRRLRTAMIGPPQAALRFTLGRARLPVEAALWLFIAATLVLPIVSLVATALVRTYGLPLTLDSMTLDNFTEVLFRQSVTLRAFTNSTLTAGAAAVVLAIMATVLGYYIIQKESRAKRAIGASITVLAEVTYAVPGLVISIAFILAFIHPLPILNWSLYGTLGIIFLAYVAAFFSIALKPVSAAYAQLDPNLDDAARVSGARFPIRMRRIFLPLIAPAAASGGLLVFLTAYNEVTVSALLWSSGNETIGTTIFNYEDGGYTTLASAMASITVLGTVVLMLLINTLGRRLPAGVIPWRG